MLGDAAELLGLFAKAGIPNTQLRTEAGTVRFPSIKSWVFTNVKGWTLADLINDQEYETLRHEAQMEMRGFQQADGAVAFPSSVHIVSATKP